MTSTKPEKTAATDTVELNDAALDRAVGGGAPTGSETLVGIDFRPASGFYGTGVYKTTDGGRGG